MTLAEIERAEPVYESHAGFSEDITGCRRYEDLPGAARAYVDRVEALAGVPVELISVGPGRDETITRTDPFRAI
jgi:adenylosuccinate synthase